MAAAPGVANQDPSRSEACPSSLQRPPFLLQGEAYLLPFRANEARDLEISALQEKGYLKPRSSRSQRDPRCSPAGVQSSAAGRLKKSWRDSLVLGSLAPFAMTAGGNSLLMRSTVALLDTTSTVSSPWSLSRRSKE